jgi:hypothetical protein
MNWKGFGSGYGLIWGPYSLLVWREWKTEPDTTCSQVRMLHVSCDDWRCNFQDENVPYVFYVNEKEIQATLGAALDEDKLDTERVLDIVYQQQAVFRVRAVTRCTR